jgi:hypothetical protein
MSFFYGKSRLSNRENVYRKTSEHGHISFSPASASYSASFSFTPFSKIFYAFRTIPSKKEPLGAKTK